MQKRNPRGVGMRNRVGLVAIAATVALAGGVWAATPVVDEVARQAWEMAAGGKLDQLWSRIQQLQAGPKAGQAVSSLQEKVREHEQHQHRRRSETREAFERAMADMNAAREEGNLPKALSQAVEAHGLTRDQQAFLNRDAVQGLVAGAEEAAAVDEKAGKWFEALLLYRRLDLLFDERGVYGEEIGRVSRKLRLLRMYAPEAYYAQSDAYAKSQGEEPGERWGGEDADGWQKQLQGVERSMLLDALDVTTSTHVEDPDYRKLLAAGADALLAMFDVEPLAKHFEGLGNEKKADAFAEFLRAMKADVKRGDDILTRRKVDKHIERLIEANGETVALPQRVLVFEFADGALSSLDDFTSIVWPHDMEQFKRTTKQEFTGVGIQITLSDGELTVVSPLEGTPAHRAGLKAGDRIVTIDGKSTTGITLSQAVRAITGEENTSVTLGVRGAGSDKTRKVELTRKKIQIHSVKGFQREPGGKWNYWIDKHQRIGYLRLTQFGPSSAVEIDKAVNRMQADGGINGLVIDLRFNPGGLLKTAVEVANRFIPADVDGDGADHDDDPRNKPDEIIVSGHAGPGRNAWVAVSDDKTTYPRFPVVVLINKGSASASEIVAGALQDHGRALVVGENSYGKGSIQELKRIGPSGWFDNTPEAMLKVTTQYYKLPSGRIIHRRPGAEKWGVKPDVLVPMTDKQVSRLIRARMVTSVLREADEEVDTEAVLGTGSDDENAEALKDLPETATQLLNDGFDPQLETAVLLLRARLLDDLARG